MEHYSGSSISGHLENVYPKHWLWCKPNGNYGKGRDFFHIHWEVHEQNPGDIRFHVEAPRIAVDPVLNEIKREVIHALLQSDVEMVVKQHGYGYKIGRRLSEQAIEKNKSTEPFRVLLMDTQRQPSHRQNLETVHTAIGPKVDSIVQPFRERLDAHFAQG